MRQALIFALLLWFVALSASAELRVALVPLDETGRNHADLALADLADEPDVAFLERSEIDKIRDEIQLSALSDYIPEPEIMQNTQLFILLKNKQMIAFDSRTGVRLWDCEWRDLPELTVAVKAAISKQRGFSADSLKKVSAMPLVPAHLDETQEKMARRAETLMLQKLCARSDLVLLERRHLLYLLNEPNAAEKNLTEHLFAGAVVMKPTAVAQGKKGILLKLQFYSPDGKRHRGESTISIANATVLEKTIEKEMEALTIPDDAQEDKKGEASQFIREAWFAFSHGLEDDALSSGASAVALDDNYAQELARIAFLSAGQLLMQDSGKKDSCKIDMALDNMRFGAELVERHKGYSREGKRAATMILLHISRSSFERMSLKQQKVFMETLEKLIMLRKRQLDAEWMPLVDSAEPRWPNGVFRVETLAQYVQDLHSFCSISWDLSLWRKHVYPELERFIDAYNDMLPEIEQFGHLSWKEKLSIVSNPNIKKRRTPYNRQFGGMNMFNNSFRFHNWDASESSKMTGEERNFQKTAYRRMMSSKYFPLAKSGLDGLMALKYGIGGVWIRNENNDNKEALTFYYAELKRIMNNVSTVSIGANSSGFMVASDGFVRERMEIQDIAVRRLNWFEPFGDMLLTGYEKWTAKTAKEVYDKLSELEKASLANIGKDDIPKTHRSQRVKDYFGRQLLKLEKQFGFKNEQRMKTPVINPYCQVYSPFAHDKSIISLTYAGTENNSLYFFVHTRDNLLSLQRIALDSPAQPRQLSQLTLPEASYDRIFGTVLDDCYAAFLAKGSLAWICVFPKKGGQPNMITVKNYCKSSSVFAYAAFCGGGDSLFVSCDGEGKFSGKLVQYNVRTGETKLLASTLDRSVKWPLQGIDYPYVIKPLICDAKNKRIVTLLNSKPHPNTGETFYDVALWAYYWETGEWKVLSKYLPCKNVESGLGLRYIEGVFWLACDYGFGRINKEGNFQPVFLIGTERHLSDKGIRYGSSSFKKVVVDLSKIRHPAPQYQILMDWDLHFNACNGKLFFGQRCIMLIDEQRFFRVEDGFRVTHCIGDKYCIGLHRQKEFQIRVLKSMEEMKSTEDFQK